MSGRPSEILIRSTNWIGDVVMSLGALRELRRLNPGSRLTALARDWVSPIYEDQGLVDRVIRFPGPHSLNLRRQIRGFDRAILFQNAFEAALLVFLAGIPERYGYATQGRGLLLTRRARPRIAELRRHQVYYYLDLLWQTGLSPVDYLSNPEMRPDISLRPSARGLSASETLLRGQGLLDGRVLVGLNPGATFGPAKRWLTERYAGLADRLVREVNAAVLIFGSKSEIPIAEAIRSSMRETPVVLAGRTDLTLLMALISRCGVLITNDSGPMHLASALDVPQVALFGSTDEVATGPFSRNATVIHKHVECSPCLRRECPIDLRCFTRITVDETFEAVKERLSNA